MNISIIIPTYNRGKYIGITIDSFLKQEYLHGLVEIIVVDNNSTDNTCEVVHDFIAQYPSGKVRYHLEEKQGLHYGRNTGARIAQYELLYYTDDDTYAPPNLLTELIKPFRFDPAVACATGKVLPRWEAPPPAWVLRHLNNHLLSLLDSPDDFVITKELPYIYGCHQAVLRKVVLEVNGSNPELIKSKAVGNGENGLNEKIKAKGYKFGFNGRCILYHIMPPSRTTQSYLNKRIGRSGPVHAYTRYRKLQPSNARWLLITFAICFIKGPLQIAGFIGKAVIKGDAAYLRFALAYVFYYWSTLTYSLKIVFNPEWKKFVLKNDWLTNDQEFYNLLFK